MLLLGDGVLNLTSMLLREWASVVVHAVLSAAEVKSSLMISHERLVIHTDVDPLSLLASFPPPTRFSLVIMSVLVEVSIEYSVRVLTAVMRSIERVMEEGGVLRVVLDTKDAVLLERLCSSHQAFVFVSCEEVTTMCHYGESKGPFDKGCLVIFRRITSG